MPIHVDWTEIVKQAPFYVIFVWYISWQSSRFLGWLDKDREKQSEEREQLYKVVRESAQVQADAILALTRQCAVAQAQNAVQKKGE